jgi:hypothetical protein
MAPTKPSQSRELELGSFSQNDFRQTGPCPQSLPPRLVWRCARSGLTPQTAAGGSTSPDAKSICAINSAGTARRSAAPISGLVQLPRSPDHPSVRQWRRRLGGCFHVEPLWRAAWRLDFNRPAAIQGLGNAWRSRGQPRSASRSPSSSRRNGAGLAKRGWMAGDFLFEPKAG